MPYNHSFGSPACTDSPHSVSNNHSSGSPSLYWIANLSALYQLLWIAQLLTYRYTECPIHTCLDRPASTESLNSAPYTHYSGSPSLHRFVTLNALYPILWIALHVSIRYTECPIPTPLDRPACTESIHWVPYTNFSGSSSLYWFATLSALYPLPSISQPVPFATLSALYSLPTLYRVATLSVLYPLLWISQPVLSRDPECPIPTPLVRPACTDSLHWVPYTHSSLSPSVYHVASLSALDPLPWIAQPVLIRCTVCPIPTPLNRPAGTESLHWVPYTHSTESPSLYWFATLNALYPLLSIAQPVQSRYTECSIPTPLHRPACTESLHWVPYTHSFSSPSLHWVATLSALYPLLWFAQPVPSPYTECPISTPLDRPACTDSLHFVPYTHSSGSPSLYLVATLSSL